ncbi:origin recognition complex subunit 3 N-terminus-domain-containing protein [Collybia nuda]|uniref:Origin recognition complex subunit 3 N-terminus-domain-containing protein n=1 Tax=Collybia nuda TaxID=64659 RepID=A0A9P5YCX9_9AGAR|nr:origin recognition complex subunit 3 N-terminus-domain-containing protein [Collybia nuda]
MTSIPNLDDINQTAYYIPFSGSADDEAGNAISLPLQRSKNDLPDGDGMRLDAYMKAWRKTLDRMQSLIRALHAPVVEQVIKKVHNSYTNVLPGLPYPELPVVCITNPTSSSSFINDVAVRLDSTELDKGDLPDIPFLSTSLYPTDCGNITSAMKAVIGGFVDRPELLMKVKRKPTTSLASHDIEMLVAWYKSIRETYNVTALSQPKLVVIMHDFEEFDPGIVQDLFYICSLHVPRLPLVFMLSLSSPPSPSYLQLTYPRSTMALLRTHKFDVPSGIKILEEVVLKTYFDPEFEPDVMIGPTTLKHLIDNFTRQNSSLEASISILHLAHLKHFSTEPLTFLTQSTPSSDTLSHPSSFHTLDDLLTRLQGSAQSTDKEQGADWPDTIPALIATIDYARTTFYSRIRRLRIGSRLIQLVQKFMKTQGYKGLDWDQRPGGSSILDVMVDILRGKLGAGVKFLGTMVKKLKARQLSVLLEEIHIFFQTLPTALRSNEEEAREKIMASRSALPEQMDIDISAISSQLAESIGEWLVEYLNNLLRPLEETALWEVWYTGLSPFPSDLMNPSVRASMLAGLLRPYDFVDSDDSEGVTHSLSELPDTSILFRRYLDSGKMINVYDWFESFQLELETQRKHLRKKLAPEAIKVERGSPKKGKGKREVTSGGDPLEDDDGEEKWRVEVQARFMRALQELDYLGFIKHTGRKADHVQRIVYDIHD